jgi:chromosome segregation ATPase
VAKTTQNVMIKTKSESESNFMVLQAEFNELQVEMERCKRLAKYDVDDMTRVNRSLRADIEAMAAEKFANEEELEMKCAQYDELYNDLERLSETFVAQYEELQHLEHLIKKLQLENQRLKASDAEKLKIIGDIKQRLEEKVFQGPSDEFIGVVEVGGEEQA